MIKIYSARTNPFNESISRYLIKDIYPAICELFPEAKKMRLTVDVSDTKWVADPVEIDLFADCTVLKLNTNCKVYGALLRQSEFTQEIGFDDYYKTDNPQLFLWNDRLKVTRDRFIGAWILDKNEPYILYFDLH